MLVIYDKIVCSIKDDKKEISKHYSGRYGAPGMPREKRGKKTPEEMARQNYWLKCRELRRTIELNFGPDDWHVTLTCRKEQRPSMEDAVKVIREFRNKLREEYKKQGWQLKYIITCETGQRGAVHWHMILNNMHSGQTTTEKLVRKHWKLGHSYFSPMDDSGDYKKLAEYIIKETTHRMEEQKTMEKLSYMSSRNLIRPAQTTKVEKVRSNRWRKNPTIPEGWYLVEGSLINGINKYTGLPYQHYTIRRKEGYEDEDSKPVHSGKRKRTEKAGRKVRVHSGDANGTTGESDNADER